ncbi:MAG TPA: cyclopropane-fatty-acyl-phospholipid synthase family protein [Roseiflexaceae bacterium]|nr:cyclopropane-fatty-acyl-phospholipid synthase family protein [Roseiflexaceae bacterium]HMP39892.1 cyclopropane-fatty-acyl-phospholipid synthase family protein [Roseiflexaceae bacterium]
MDDRYTLSTPGALNEHTTTLLDHLFPPPRSFAVRLWDGTTIASPHPAFTLILNHPGALRRMFTPPIELSLGEAFIYGDCAIDGDLYTAIAQFDQLLHQPTTPTNLAGMLRHLMALPHSTSRPAAGRGAADLAGTPHSRTRDRDAIQYHYDVGNDFYALWLDPHMQYSCAYFPTGTEDLALAQERKLEHICRKLRLQPGDQLLDIGCGWGGLARYAATHYDAHVLGVTLSRRQAEYANQRIDAAGLRGRVSIELCDYRDLQASSFDKIVSIGMFEHVGKQRLPEYFATAYRLLKPGGIFLNHGIAQHTARTAHSSLSSYPGHESFWPQIVRRHIIGAGRFSQRYIFPDGELVPISYANLIAEEFGLEVRDVENLREHYARTLRHWVSRLEERQQEAIRQTDEVTFRTWRLYMAATAYYFSCSRVGVYQSLLAKPHAGVVDLPPSRADLYREYSSAAQ